MSEKGGERVDALYMGTMRKVEWDQMKEDWIIYLSRRNIVLPLVNIVMWVQAHPDESILARNTLQKVKTAD